MVRWRILSFDVGLRNLAFALIESDVSGHRVSIHRWEVLNVDPSAGLVPSLVQTLDESDLSGADFVLIENQPCLRNPKMKTVQVAIHAYFETLRHYMGPDQGLRYPVRLVSASNKLLGVAGAGDKPTYKDRKRLAVSRCLDFIETELVETEGSMSRDKCRSLFEITKKKDDLADCLLQAVWFVRSHPTQPDVP